jgi:hypothetical protein
MTGQAAYGRSEDSTGDGHSPYRVALICPVLDDWESIVLLLRSVADHFADQDVSLQALIVDDGSARRWDWTMISLPLAPCLISIEILRLVLNLGHQRAITVGLVEACSRPEIDAVLIMDGDGEDQPQDAVRLIAEVRNSGHVALALRAVRSESLLFKTFYKLYKIAFRALTGRHIAFGNFSAMSSEAAWRLTHMPELWNNLAGAILRSRLPIRLLPTARGRRYAGHSSMSLVALIMHGLGAMSVYADVVVTRVLIAAGFLSTITIAGIVVAVLVKLLTNLAIPGWTTNVVGILVIMLIQLILVAGFAAFQALAARSARPIIPLTDCKIFVEDRDQRLGPAFDATYRP